MSPSTTRRDISDSAVAQLDPVAAENLETTVRDLLRETPHASLESLLESLTSITLNFCDSELHHTQNERQPRELKRNLTKLKRRTTTFLTFLNRLPDQVREEIDLYLPEPVEIPAQQSFEERPTQNDHCPENTASPHEFRSHLQSQYIEPIIERLTALLNDIDALERISRDVNRLSDIQRLDRPAWFMLALQIGTFLQDELGIAPSSTTEGLCDQLFRACLDAGLTTIGSKARAPGDLRHYTRLAINPTSRIRGVERG